MQREEVARKLVLRLTEPCGGGKPGWHADTSVFARRAVSDLVDYIDAHLQTAPSLSEMASLVRLSPSHFAKKFRQSTGLSLNRFINLRRVHRALDTLMENRDSLAGRLPRRRFARAGGSPTPVARRRIGEARAALDGERGRGASTAVPVPGNRDTIRPGTGALRPS